MTRGDALAVVAANSSWQTFLKISTLCRSIHNMTIRKLAEIHVRSAGCELFHMHPALRCTRAGLIAGFEALSATPVSKIDMEETLAMWDLLAMTHDPEAVCFSWLSKRLGE